MKKVKMGIKQDLQRIQLDRNHFHIHRRAEEMANTEQSGGWYLILTQPHPQTSKIKKE